MQHDRSITTVESPTILPIVINDAVWKDLKSSTPSFFEPVRKCISKIARQQRDSGLRVKKLVGIDRRLWEARINGASRLLFTYRRSLDGNNKSYGLIAIEAICTDHDDVSRRAKRIDLNHWEGIESDALFSLDREYDPLIAEERMEIDRLWQQEESEIYSHSTDELLGNIKWSILNPEIIESEQEWQRAIESGEDLQLRLSPEERKLIDINGNILLSGSAGTGKTTVALYRLAETVQMYPTAKHLYTAYNPILVKESKEQFKKISGISNEPLPPNIDFLTIQDLCLKIAQDCGEKFDLPLVGYPEFYSRYIKKPERKSYPPSLLWDEIRSVIKGGNLSEQIDRHLLNVNEYEELGKNRSGIIAQNKRREVHKLAQWYQSILNSKKWADEIDITRRALWFIRKYSYNPYTSIFCDEVQDFTEIQLELLIRLLAKDGRVLCAGDINQMIAPSGFRWEDLTTRLYYQNRQWSKETLSFNFRSTGKLVSLALKILKLKSKFLGGSHPKEDFSVGTNGEFARLLQVSSGDIERIKLGAADAILVRTEERKQKLIETLGTVLVFTIEESKGLEFDTVYLIEFFEKSKELWRIALNPSRSLKENQKPELRLEFNLLYVAISRARRLLNICEEEISELWKQTEIRDSVIPIDVDTAFSQALHINASSWREQSMYYRDARLLSQALECAIKSGDKDLQQEIESEIKIGELLLSHQYAEAARLLLEIRSYTKAAELFEKVSEWQEASKAWSLAGDSDKANECEIKHLIGNGQKREAIQILIDQERYVEAIFFLQEMHDLEKASELLLRIGHIEDLNSSIDYQKLLSRQRKLESSFQSKEPTQHQALSNDGKKSNRKNNVSKPTNFNKDKKLPINSSNDDLFVIKYHSGFGDTPQDATNNLETIEYYLKTPQNAIDYWHRGFIKYTRLFDSQGALSDYNKAIALDPGCAEAYYYRGFLKDHKFDDPEGALSDYDRAIDLNPNYVDAYINRGMLKLNKLNDPEGARADFTI